MPCVRLDRLLVAALALTSSGCVRKHVENDTSVFTFEWWTVALCIVGGIVLGGIGIYLFSKKHMVRGALLAFGGVLGLASAPGYFTEVAKVNDSELVTTEGNWYTRSVAKIKFDEVEAVRVDVSESRRRFRTTKNYTLVFKMKERGAHHVSLGAIEQAALPEIVAQLQKRNVAIQGFEQLPDDMK